MASTPTVILLMGPTASGKTEAALRIAEAAAVDLVSVDSAMVYRRMDIGTAKPSAAVLARHPHALVDILDPAETYSVARFVADADAAVRAAVASGRTPILVGGTMLYFRAFRDGIDRLPPARADVRHAIAERAAAHGWPALHRELAERDPRAAAAIDANNGRRIQRALEVYELTGRSIAAHWRVDAIPATERLGCRVIEIAIVPGERAILHERIARRLDAMLERGLVDEVRMLRDDEALNADLPSMRAVGYRQVWRYLDGHYDCAEMERRVAAATRQVAKRQLTWLRKCRANVVGDAQTAATQALQNIPRQRIVALRHRGAAR